MTKEQKDVLCKMFADYGNMTAKEENVRHNDLLTDKEKEEKIKQIQEEESMLIKKFADFLSEA